MTIIFISSPFKGNKYIVLSVEVAPRAVINRSEPQDRQPIPKIPNIIALIPSPADLKFLKRFLTVKIQIDMLIPIRTEIMAYNMCWRGVKFDKLPKRAEKKEFNLASILKRELLNTKLSQLY